MSALRKLTAGEVTFTVEIEPEDTPVRGNFMCTDDAEQDKRDEDEILARLDRGDFEAWCVVKVTARWKRYSATEYLGGCSFGRESEAEETATECGMQAEALDRLNAKIAAEHAELESLVTE